MLYTLFHRGVPIGTAEADDPRALSAVMVRQLPAFDALRSAVPVWRGVPGVTAVGAAGFTEGLELHDALGAPVPATRLDVWIVDAAHMLLFAQFDLTGAPVGAPLWPAPRTSHGVADGDGSVRR